MRGKWFNRVFILTILLGILVPATTSGSHLDASLPAPGPPRIHQPKQVQKQGAPRRRVPVSSSSSRINSDVPSLTHERPIPQLAEQSNQPTKPHTKLGWQFLLNGQTQAAMAAYRQALRHNPQSAKAYLGLGITLKNLGKVVLAKKAMLKAVNLDPRFPSALVHLGYLYAEGHFGQSDFSTARRLFQEASQLGDPFATIALLDMKSRPTL